MIFKTSSAKLVTNLVRSHCFKPFLELYEDRSIEEVSTVTKKFEWRTVANTILEENDLNFADPTGFTFYGIAENGKFTKNITGYRFQVCFIIKSFLTYSFFSPTPALSTIYRLLWSSMCSITPETANVGSSYNRMRGPGIGCWFSDRSNCSHWSLTPTLTSDNLSLYTTLLLLLVLIQLCSPCCSWLQLLPYKV